MYREPILVSTRFSTTSNLLTALWTDTPSIGKGWVPVNVKDETHAKGLAVWWNSTPVIMMLLNRRGKKITYPKWSLEHLREIKISKQDNLEWSALKDAYEQICNRELLPLSKAVDDPVRKIIDDAWSGPLVLVPLFA